METKQCLHCNFTKDIKEFPTDKSRPSGVFSYCKKCCCKLASETRNKKKRLKELGQEKEKCCPTCMAVKPMEDFPAQDGRLDGRSTRCLVCAASYRKKFKDSRNSRGSATSQLYYHLNKHKISQRAKERGLKRKLHLVDLLGGKCSSCGLIVGDEWPHFCFDFHHVDEKSFSISAILQRSERVYQRYIHDEIKKCVLLCSNCHRRTHLHTKQQGS